MYNGEKLIKFMHDRNFGKKDLAEELSVNSARIDELCRGKEIKTLIDRISNKYGVPTSSFYGDYIEPQFMKDVRDKIKDADSKGFSYNEFAQLANVNKNVIRDIVNHPSFICSDNIASKILNVNI